LEIVCIIDLTIADLFIYRVLLDNRLINHFI